MPKNSNLETVFRNKRWDLRDWRGTHRHGIQLFTEIEIEIEIALSDAFKTLNLTLNRTKSKTLIAKRKKKRRRRARFYATVPHVPSTPTPTFGSRNPIRASVRGISMRARDPPSIVILTVDVVSIVREVVWRGWSAGDVGNVRGTCESARFDALGPRRSFHLL